MTIKIINYIVLAIISLILIVKFRDFKKIIFGFGPFLLADIAGIWIHNLVSDPENHLSPNGEKLVALFCGVLVFLVLEWVAFKFHEKDELMKKMNDLDIKEFHKLQWDAIKKTTELDKFYSQWNLFKDEWKEYKEIVSDIKKSKSRTGAILDKFAKSNLIVESLSSKIKDDLELDEHITRDQDQKEFHDIITTLKYNEFFASHFIFNAKEKKVLQIPSWYFKNRIWKEFVTQSPCYYSVQRLDKGQADIYLKDTNRMYEETNHLSRNLTGNNKTEIKKIFIIDDSSFQNNGKLKKKEDGKLEDKNNKDKDKTLEKKYENLTIYLQHWNDTFQAKQDIFPIMVIKESQAIGIADRTGFTLNDTGIFGNVYGIQSTNDLKNGMFYTDELKIDFYFDKKNTKKKIDDFDVLMLSAKKLNDVL